MIKKSDVAKNAAKAEIVKLGKKSKMLYYEDITIKTGLDKKLIAKACDELSAEGVIGYALVNR